MNINHIALYCLDLEGMREFFIRYFSCTSNEMYHNPRTGLKTYILSFADSDARIELMTRPEVSEETNNIYRQGFIHMSVSVGSEKEVDRITDCLKADGYEVVSAPRTTGDGYYESCIAGPERILIEITV